MREDGLEISFVSHLLQVDNLRTRFYTRNGVIHAVNGISYQLDEGESLGIVGESGSGKSVSALSVMGLIPNPPGRIESGEILFKGQDLLKLSEEEMCKIRGRKIAMVFQDPMTSLNPVLTIGKQMTESIQLHFGMSPSNAAARAKEMLRLVGLPNMDERFRGYPHQFSGGQRQRIMIAMALSCDPSILIADEPTTALDVTVQAQILALTRELQTEIGLAMIWITHDLGVVAGTVEKVAVMYSGFIVELAPVRNIFRSPAHPYTLGLLQAIPKINSAEKEKLVTIKGLPPDLREEPKSCPFAARCPYVIDRCLEDNPPLMEVRPGHTSACWRWEHILKEPHFGANP
jgi:oligopeptide transport system ATP-binding protein